MHITDRCHGESGRDYALRVIKENIVSMELAPGSLISENELSAQLGLSRTPVREALIELSKVNIVEINPQKRTLVMPISFALVDECRFMRLNLECAAAELACKRMTPEGVALLRENVRMQEIYFQENKLEALSDADNDFHRIIFRMAGKPLVFQQIRNFNIHYDRVRHLTLTDINELKIVGDHKMLAEAIAAQDAPRAKKLMRIHLDRFKTESVELQKKFPQYFIP